MLNIIALFAQIGGDANRAYVPAAVRNKRAGLVTFSKCSTPTEVAIGIGDRQLTAALGPVVDALADGEDRHLLHDGVIDRPDMERTPHWIHADVIRISADVFRVVGEASPIRRWRRDILLPGSQVLLQADASELGQHHRLEAGGLSAISKNAAQAVVTANRAVEDVRRGRGCGVRAFRLAAGNGTWANDLILRAASYCKSWIKAARVVCSSKGCTNLAVELIQLGLACKLKAVKKVVGAGAAHLVHKRQSPVVACSGYLEDRSPIACIGGFWRRIGHKSRPEDRFAQVAGHCDQAATTRQDDATRAGRVEGPQLSIGWNLSVGPFGHRRTSAIFNNRSARHQDDADEIVIS